MIQSYLKGRVLVKVGDLTNETVDAIVNAANSTLLGGGGVDGAIHDRGGPQILAECKALRAAQYKDGLPTGQAVITTGGALPAKYVIHTVGPIYGSNKGRDAELLAACYINSLRLAAQYGLLSIAFPSISTGVFGYPQPEAAKVASTAIRSFVRENEVPFEIRLVFFSEAAAASFVSHNSFQSDLV